MKKIATKVNSNEKEEILKTLRASYEVLEEKLESVNNKIEKLESELKGGFGIEKEKE